MKASYALLWAACGLAAASTPRDETVVQTKQGPVQGYVNQDARVFRGVPYAAPPVGELRWRDPVAREPWAPKVWSALKDGAGCPQKCDLPKLTCPPVKSEDCLFLNVFTPRQAKLSKPLPVMFWIHGGDFYLGYGGGFLYNGTAMVSRRNVVLVEINYRLGALGFLYDGKGLMGNFGLKDQQFALRWTRDNIAAFGGDPNQVTIFGQSAGAMSAGIHMLLPDSDALFHAAVMQSNPYGIPYRTGKQATSFQESFAHELKCRPASRDYEKCLRAATPEAIVTAATAIQTSLLKNLSDVDGLLCPWSPTIDGKLLKLQPFHAFQRGLAQNKPVIVGSTRQEGVVFAFISSSPLSCTGFETKMVAFFGAVDGEKVIHQYPCPKHVKDLRVHAGNVITDAMFHCPIRNVADAFSKNGRPAHIYEYMYNLNPSIGVPLWNATDPECEHYVCHSEDLGLTFYPAMWPLGPQAHYLANETTVSTALQTYWTQLLPEKGPGSFGDVAWGAYNTSTEATMQLGTPLKQAAAPWRSKCAFWDEMGYKWVKDPKR